MSMTTSVLDGPELVTSTDGTAIACWYGGVGPPLLLVHGAMSDHQRWRITPLLQPYRTVYVMDRRGRGGSGDAVEWSLDREVDDVVAVIDAAASREDSTVDVLGHSLGGLLALWAAADSPHVRRLVLYEPAINEAAQPDDVLDRMRRALDEGRPEDVVRIMMRDVVRMPAHEIAALEALPSWPSRVATAHTLPREMSQALSWDPEQGRRVSVPTLLILGADSPGFVHDAVGLVDAALPDSRVVVLEGQQHVADQLVPEEFARIVLRFLDPDDDEGADRW
jgi:pimeloyl-ACP methyl ester carboxylesterase